MTQLRVSGNDPDYERIQAERDQRALVFRGYLFLGLSAVALLAWVLFPQARDGDSVDARELRTFLANCLVYVVIPGLWLASGFCLSHAKYLAFVFRE
jgi:hypothetical protein